MIRSSEIDKLKFSYVMVIPPLMLLGRISSRENRSSEVRINLELDAVYLFKELSDNVSQALICFSTKIKMISVKKQELILQVTICEKINKLLNPYL